MPRTTNASRTSIWQRLLDIIYPPSCALCQVKLDAGRCLCAVCDADLPRLTAPFCDTCGEGFPGQIHEEFSCQNCSNLKFSFEFARPAMIRDERTLELIHRLKYARELHLARDLGRLAAEALADPRFAPAIAEKWPLVPVPLHLRREQNRHFNQAAEIARSLGSISGLPVLHALRRTRSTEHQTALTRAQRLANLRGAFVLSRSGLRASRKPTGAILVDDVLTTGSTVDECAKILRKAGFHPIAVVTVMRG